MALDEYEAKLVSELWQCEEADGIPCKQCPVFEECVKLATYTPAATFDKHEYSQFIVSFYALKGKKRRLLRERVISDGTSGGGK